ncbi:hypothetical protein [Thermoflexus sp.]|uniref:hypothetical protein n=1 Tax=Thermoflexus sp. TaxID=1969742 RepID=UPI0035E42D39
MTRYGRALEAQGWRLVNAKSREWALVRTEQKELIIRAQGAGLIIEVDPRYQQA